MHTSSNTWHHTMFFHKSNTVTHQTFTCQSNFSLLKVCVHCRTMFVFHKSNAVTNIWFTWQSNFYLLKVCAHCCTCTSLNSQYVCRFKLVSRYKMEKLLYNCYEILRTYMIIYIYIIYLIHVQILFSH